MPSFGVIVFPGSNCDHDCYHVIKNVMGAECEFVWHEETSLSGLECLIIPGGFSYGDYLRAGAIARFSPIMSALKEFASRGGLVLGICNGFQVLVESWMLPGALWKNSSLRFVCKWVNIRVENSNTPFTNQIKEGEVLRIPIAHGEGNYIAEEDVVDHLKEGNRVVFRYCNEGGDATESSNPNGSVRNIAGIANEGLNVLGMMPHPERCSEEALSGRDGALIFESIISWLNGSHEAGRGKHGT